MKTWIAMALVGLFAVMGQAQANEAISKMEVNAFMEQVRISSMVQQKIIQAQTELRTDFSLLQRAGMDNTSISLMQEMKYKKLNHMLSEVATVIALSESTGYSEN